MPKSARIYIGWILAAAICILLAGLCNWECKDGARYLGYFVLTLLGSMLKVKLPGVVGTFSLSFVFILPAIAVLSLPEALTVACASALVQCLWRSKNEPQLIQVLFSVCNLVIDVAAAYAVFHFAPLHAITGNLIGLMALAAAVLYIANTGLLSIALALVEGKPLKTMWEHWVVWSFPYYLAGAVVAGTFVPTSQYVDWKSWALITPLLFLVYFCYRRHVDVPSRELLRSTPSFEIKAA